jgi:site-specific DNA-cytosine methylase
MVSGVVDRGLKCLHGLLNLSNITSVFISAMKRTSLLNDIQLVKQRSVCDMNVLSLFDGISCGQVALNRAAISYDKYFASEIEKRAISVTQDNFPETIQLGSVLDVKADNLPKIDLLMGGSPCQGFSFAGKQLNFDDPRSKLFFEFVRLKNELKPKYWLLENVPMRQEYMDIISECLGVKPVKINSKIKSPQNRVRYYWTNIEFEIEENDVQLSSTIGDYDGIFVRARGGNKGGVQSYKGKAPCITTSAWEHNFFPVFDGVPRKFTPEEAEQIQTLPAGYTKKLSDHQRYKAVGNGWTVDIIADIFRGMK